MTEVKIVDRESTLNLPVSRELLISELSRLSKLIRNKEYEIENRVSHVRPHGKNSSDTLELPDGRFMTKQCFWLNNTYIRSQIEVANLD